MRRWSVRLPITGYALIEVNAEDETSAIAAAIGEDCPFDYVEEWYPIEQVVRGNVFCGSLNKADAQDIGEPEDA